MPLRPSEPKTWASMQRARAGASPGVREKPRNSRSFGSAARQREQKLQELEKGLAMYSHRTPAGPSVASNSRYIEPRQSRAAVADDAPPQTALSRPGTRLAAPALAYTSNLQEADELLACLGPGPLGFDLEWNPTYIAGQTPRTAVLQICSRSLILVIQLSAMRKFPPMLSEILQNQDIIKTGVAIRNDALRLQTEYKVRMRNIVELSALAKLAQPALWGTTKHLISLRNLTRVYLGQRLDKGDVRVGNWKARPLSAEQIEYAANDTFAGLEILRELCTYLPPAGAQVDLLTQLDQMLFGKPPSNEINLSQALRLSSHDLHAEYQDLQHRERRKDSVSTTLREIQPNLQTVAPSASAPGKRRCAGSKSGR